MSWIKKAEVTQDMIREAMESFRQIGDGVNGLKGAGKQMKDIELLTMIDRLAVIENEIRQYLNKKYKWD